MATQQIFNYIWNNPNVAMDELESYFNTRAKSNSIAVHLSKIRAALAHTIYRLRSEPDPHYDGTGRRAKHRYKIIEAPHVHV